MVADFRRVYGLSLYEMGRAYTWREGHTLSMKLLEDSSSLTHTAFAEWTRPMSLEELATRQLINVLKAVNTPKGKAVKFDKMPWDNTAAKRRNRTGGLSEYTEEEREQVRTEYADLLGRMVRGEPLTGWKPVPDKEKTTHSTL